MIPFGDTSTWGLMGDFSRQVDLSQGGGGCPGEFLATAIWLNVMGSSESQCSHWPCCDCGQLSILENAETGYVGCIRMGRQHLSPVGVTQSPGDRERQAVGETWPQRERCLSSI